jgi:ADP-heptose:LPS heptosyltransferase
MNKGLLDLLHKKLREERKLSEEELLLLLFEMVVSRNTRPEGWFTLRYQPHRIEGSIKKILIIPLSGIGDVVYTIPLALKLKERFKAPKITLLVEEEALGIVEGHPFIEAIPFPKNRYIKEFQDDERVVWRILKELGSMVKHLQEERFDLVINLHLTGCSGVISYLSWAKDHLGLLIDDHGRSIIKGNIWMLYAHYLHHRAHQDLTPLSPEELQMRMVELEPERWTLQLHIDEDVKKKGVEILDSIGIRGNGSLIGIHPGAGLSTRRWGEEKFAHLADKIQSELHTKAVIFGGPGDKEIVKRVISSMKSESLVYLGEMSDLRILPFLLSRCISLITNDTGPMHIAAAVGTPVIGICGPTYHEPYGEGNHILIQADVSCDGGRTKLGCKRLLLCKELKCMEAIDPEAVFLALKFQLGHSETLPSIPKIRLYYQDGRIPKRLFSYSLREKIRIDEEMLAWEVLKIAMLNLWIREDRRMGGSEEYIGFDEMKKRLSRLYQIDGINKALEKSIKLLEEYEDGCKEGIKALEGIYLGPSQELLTTFNTIEKRMNEGVGRLFEFLYFLFTKGKEEIGWRLNLYRERREACIYLMGLLKRWRNGRK